MGKNKWSNNKMEDVKVFWEDLIEFKNQTTNVIFEQYSLLNSLIQETEEYTKNDDKLKCVIIGLLKSFQDIVNVTHEIIKRHCTLNENNEVIDHLKGEIDINSDDYLDFIKISLDYTNAQEQMANLTYKANSEILSAIAEKEPELIDKAEIDKLDEAYLKGKSKVDKILKGAVDGFTGKAKQPRKSNGSNTRRDSSSTKPKTRRKSK